jgi:chemotaxis response regulator CheB
MSAAPDDDNPVRTQRAGAVIVPGDADPAAGTPGAPFDVVALVTSADGLSALNQVLLPLPDDFNAAVVIVQQLGGPGSSLVEILRRRSPLPVTDRKRAEQQLGAEAERMAQLLAQRTAALSDTRERLDEHENRSHRSTGPS